MARLFVFLLVLQCAVMAQELTPLDDELAAGLTPLTDRESILAVNKYQLGHVVIFERGEPGYVIGSDNSAPACWRKGAERPCYVHSIKRLPDDGEGAPRFFIDAGYEQIAGGTTGHQLSFWRWRDHRAGVLRTVDYVMGGDFAGQGVSLEGDIIRIGQKSHWQNLFACGGCDGRQMVRTLRITPAEIVDLGTVSLTPELDSLDALMSEHSDLAAEIRRFWPEGPAPLLVEPPVVTGKLLCVAPDGLPPLRFQLEGRQIVSVAKGGCAG